MKQNQLTLNFLTLAHYCDDALGVRRICSLSKLSSERVGFIQAGGKKKIVGFETVALNIFQALASVVILFKRVEVFWHWVADLTWKLQDQKWAFVMHLEKNIFQHV